MPSFANDLGHGDPGVSYSMLLAADAAGAMLAGVLLEGQGLLPAKPRTAIILAMLWCSALTGFALASSYPVALALLFTAGFHRAGPDLILTGLDGRHHIIPGYFATEHRALLATPNGASLSASWEQLVKTTSLIRTNDSSLSLIESGSELNWGKSVRQ